MSKKKRKKEMRIKFISKINFIKCINNWESVEYNVWIEEEKMWIECQDINANDLKSKKWGRMLAKLNDIDPKVQSHDDVMARCKLMKGKFCVARIHFDIDNGKNLIFGHSFKLYRFGGHKIDTILFKMLKLYCSSLNLDICIEDVCFIFSLYIDMMRINMQLILLLYI